MIASLRGTLISKSVTELTVDVNGVGYSVSIPLSTYEKIGEVNSTLTLLTYLHVREDAMQLYGFFTEEERSLFKLLISVSGVGPRMAQTVLSGISTNDCGPATHLYGFKDCSPSRALPNKCARSDLCCSLSLAERK